MNFKDIHICKADVTSSQPARNLGIIFDKEMNSKAQINNISKAGYYHVRNLIAIHNTLDLDSNFKDKHICKADVTSSQPARNLGIIFDKEMISKAQINNISKAGYYHVRNLWLTIYKAQKVANGSKCISQGINTSKEI